MLDPQEHFTKYHKLHLLTINSNFHRYPFDRKGRPRGFRRWGRAGHSIFIRSTQWSFSSGASDFLLSGARHRGRYYRQSRRWHQAWLLRRCCPTYCWRSSKVSRTPRRFPSTKRHSWGRREGRFRPCSRKARCRKHYNLQGIQGRRVSLQVAR